MTNIVYMDDCPQIGLINRGDILVKELCKKLQCDLFYYIKTTGGSSAGLQLLSKIKE